MDTFERNRHFMKVAMSLAKRAGELGEAPVGAVVVLDGEVVGAGFNLRENGRNALAHAEIIAINEACQKLGSWRLFQASLYVTLEPCPMCAGAVINSRIENVYFGAHDPKAGCFGSKTNFTQLGFNHTPNVTGGILEEECSALLTDFFRALREENREQTQ